MTKMPPPLTPDERQAILALTQDLPRLWQAPTTTQAQRKQLLRLLVKDITLTKRPKLIHIGIRWQTDALTEVTVTRPPRASESVKTPPEVLDRIRTLATDHSDAHIAQCLNQEGFQPGRKGQFTRRKITWLRGAYHIPTACPDNPIGFATTPRGDGRYSARAAAQLLNVTVSTVADWCEAGHLDFIQATPHAPRWIKLSPDDIARWRKPTRQRWLHRSGPTDPLGL